MHFFNMTAGIPSGPGAAFAESALIASFRSSVVIGIVLILIASGSSVKNSFGFVTFSCSFGVLNALHMSLSTVQLQFHQYDNGWTKNR